MRYSFTVPTEFNLKSTIYSHGWCALLPFSVKKEDNRLTRIFELPTGKILTPNIAEQKKNDRNILSISTEQKLSPIEQKHLTQQIKTCLRLDEKYDVFYQLAGAHKDFNWIPQLGAGRLLRAPTVFEDVVKMICTTNCSWALTEIMVENLCKKMGIQVSETEFTFPNPEAIADSSEKYIRKEIRAGYRAPYLLELSKRLVKNELEIEQWRTSDLPTEELFKLVRSVKGIGPYAAGNILKLLGRYDYLAIDSWCRANFFEKHRNGRKTTDKVIEKFYKPLGEWRGLFFWLDLTQYWYQKEFTF